MSTQATQQKPKPVAVIKEHLDNGSPIPLFVGTLTKLFPAKHSKPGDAREWCLQNGEIKDDAGQSIGIKFKDREPLDVQQWKGKRVTLSCHDGEKGLTGIWVDDDEYPAGTITRIIKVTKTGNVELADGSGGAAPAEQRQQRAEPQERQQQRAATPPADTQQRQTTQRAQTQEKAAAPPLLEAKRVIARVAALHGLCLDAAVSTAAGFQKRHGYAVVPTTVMIWADKFLMETIRRTGIDGIPFNPYAQKEYEGVRLIDLIPELQNQLATSEAEKQERVEAARQKLAVRAETNAPAEQRQQRAEPQEQPQESMMDGMEDDDIPF